MSQAPPPLPLLRVRQLRRAHFHALIGPTPAVVLVESGAKTVEGDGFRVTVPAGGIALLPDRVPLHIENRTGPGGLYEARMIGIDRVRFARAEALAGLSDVPRSTEIGIDKPSSGLIGSFRRLEEKLQDPDAVPYPILNLIVAELVAWLAEDGLRLPALAPPSFAEQVRSLIEAAPDRDWKAEDVAACLATSEPTLRRRLRAEGLTFLAILTDVRMTQALALLQSTHWSIAAIALSVGYESPSRFAGRFRDRFGLQPHEIRMREHDSDRIGTAIDRIGRAPGLAPN